MASFKVQSQHFSGETDKSTTKKLEIILDIPKMQGSCTVIVLAQMIKELISPFEFNVSVLIQGSS
jgi:hypothetical protein